MKCAVQEGNKFVIEIRDEGIAFNGLFRPDSDTTADIEDRKGAGNFLIKKKARILPYRHIGDKLCCM